MPKPKQGPIRPKKEEGLIRGKPLFSFFVRMAASVPRRYLPPQQEPTACMTQNIHDSGHKRLTTCFCTILKFRNSVPSSGLAMHSLQGLLHADKNQTLLEALQPGADVTREPDRCEERIAACGKRRC